MPPQELQAIIQSVIQKHLSPDQTYVFLFGSRAGRSERVSSDFDIGVYRGEKIPLAVIGRIKDELEEFPIPVDVDIVDFANTSQDFRRIALKQIQIWNAPKTNLRLQLNLLRKALGTLEAALHEPMNDFIRDAAIQRFEYVFELTWKTLQVAAGHTGLRCASPREAIKAAFKMGWITNPDDWFEAMEARNRTSHTYNELVAQEVYEVARKFPALVQHVFSFVEEI